MYSLIVTAKLNDIDPQAWLADVLARIAEHPAHWLRDRSRIGVVGVKCNGCGHKRSWPIAELIRRYEPTTLVSDLWKRWRCSECGSREVVPFSVRRLSDSR